MAVKKFEIGQTVYAAGAGIYQKAKVLGPGYDRTMIYLQLPFGVCMHWERRFVLTEEEFAKETTPVLVCEEDAWI